VSYALRFEISASTIISYPLVQTGIDQDRRGRGAAPIQNCSKFRIFEDPGSAARRSAKFRAALRPGSVYPVFVKMPR
jgi:hypothetical protein